MRIRPTDVIARTGRLAAGGVLGAVIVDLAKRHGATGAARRGAVGATALALRGRRRLEVGAENLRLAGGDIVAEAREQVGEQSLPPDTDAAAHAHDH